MEWRRFVRCKVTIAVFLVATAVLQNPAEAFGEATITIGGVIYRDMYDPLRSGLEGVKVEVRGEDSVFEAVTSGVIGLWKLDVPQGTYHITPRMDGYVIEHIVPGGSDGQRSITIQVTPANMAANQSIQFLAIRSLDAVPAPASKAPPAGSSGGGCAIARERHAKARDFFAPYIACVSILFLTTYRDTRRHRRRPKS